MDSVTEDIKTRRITRYHVTMALLALTIIAVAVTTIVGSSAAVTKTGSQTQARVDATSVVVSGAENPIITLSCLDPVLTVALVLDRSGSVASDSLRHFGDETHAPNQYKDTVKNFLTQLYTEIGTRGHVNVLIYAFAGRTVLQNPTVASSGGAQTFLTDVSTIGNLNTMKDAVDRIYFNQQRKGIDPEIKSADPYDVARGYNAGVPTAYGSTNNNTNWDDGFLQVANVASSPTYNNTDPGKHIDLAIMLTDGQPNLDNGTNRVWGTDDIDRNDSRTTVLNYSTSDVTALRTGAALTPYASRPPIAVRGVLINPDITSQVTSTMQTVFGASNYSTTDNFGADLKAELDRIVDAVTNEEICTTEVVVPELTVKLSTYNVRVVENGAEVYVDATIFNPSKVAMTNVTLSVGGVLFKTGITIPPGGKAGPFTYPIKLPLGGIIPPTLRFVAHGTAAPTGRQRIPGNILDIDSPPANLNVTVGRDPLPS